MRSLYELTGAALELEELLRNESIDAQTYQDTLDSLGQETKIESICYVIRNLQAEADMFKAEKEKMNARQKTAENGVTRLKDSLLNYLTVTNQSKVKSGLFNVSVGKTESVSVIDLDKIPKEYLIPQADKVDVATIKKILKSGEEIPGAELSENQHVRIR